MFEIYQHYCNGPNAEAKLLTIYIEEAHAVDEWHLPDAPDVKKGIAIIKAHQNLNDRLTAAKTFISCKKFVCETVVDSWASNIVDRYEAWPERLYIIVDGVVVYKGGEGPFDYRLDEVQDWLAERYGMRGKSLNKDKVKN
eukprot:gene18783-24550_t